MAALGLRYLTVSGWGMELGATYQNWTTDTGNDETFFHDNTSGSTQLNRIKWESAGGYIGLRYFF
ncbi:MAG: hypothetical protein KGZ88_22415 [Methylomicrobium sp.]|nr:hypothetical protein [Methylomicrobium sp.]